jgi:hypothetical protein
MADGWPGDPPGLPWAAPKASLPRPVRAPPGQDAELAARLRCLPSDETLTGPCAPQPFLDIAGDDDLIALAADLWNERQALILGTK